MIKNMVELTYYLLIKAREYAGDCQRVFVAVSGGIDSATVAALLCRAFGPENVVGMYRDIKNSPHHLEDAKLLQKTFGFKLIFIDGNSLYDFLVAQLREQFLKLDLSWNDEGTAVATTNGFTAAFDCLKSRLTTPMAGFIAKAIDSGRGRIFGTGNGEEDGLLRYFDKFGDGAVDNNLLAGLNKAEVRQLARHLGVPQRIIVKKPSADLQACGDVHNDEDQLTQWAKNMGFDIQISYGAPDGSTEGNVAWAWREDIDKGVITGRARHFDRQTLLSMEYNDLQTDLILFLRNLEATTRHKVLGIPGTSRQELLAMGFVD